MALFKTFKGTSTDFINSTIVNKANDGYAYFTTDDGKFYIDIAGDGTQDAVIGTNRIPISGYKADMLSTSGTTSQFWRGDNTWSNTLTGGLVVDSLTANNLTASQNVNLSGETEADSLTVGNLVVNGSANFVNIPTLSVSPAAASNDTSVATTAFVKTTAGNYLPLSGGTMTGGIILPCGTTNNAYNYLGINFTNGSKIGEASGGSLGIYSAGTTIYIRPNASETVGTEGIEINTDGLRPTNNNTENLGDNNHKWANIYATTFIGDLSGNAATATKATQDASGNVITATYAPLFSPTLDGIPTAPTPDANDNSTKIATTAFVSTAVSQGFAANDAMVFKGTIGNTSAPINANRSGVPTNGYSAGWTYRVVTAGSYLSGKYCEEGDLIIAINDGPSTGDSVISTDWTIAQTNIDGALYKTNAVSYTGNKVLMSDGTGGAVKEATISTTDVDVIKGITWSSGSVTTVSVSDGVITVTPGTAPTLTTTTQSVMTDFSFS